MSKTVIGVIIIVTLLLVAVSFALRAGKTVDVTAVQESAREIAEEVSSAKVTLPANPKQGDILYWDGGAWTKLPIGKPGQILKTTDGVSLTWANASPRTAARVIAASNSSADSKAQADYVCDGVDDQVEIQAANDALADLGKESFEGQVRQGSGGTVKLLEGTYNCASLSIDSCLLSGQGESSIIRLAADTSTVTVHEGGKLHNVKVSVPSGYAGTAVIVEPKHPYVFVGKVDVLDKVLIWSENPHPYTNQTGTGLLIRATSVGTGNSLMLSSFGDITVYGAFEYSMRVSATRTGDIMSFLTGNIFRTLILCQGKYLLTVEGIGDGDGGACAGNIFHAIQLQPTSTTVHGIHLVGLSHENKFLAVHAWDWSGAKGNSLLIDSGVSGTYAMGYLKEGCYLDNGTGSKIIHVPQ